MRCTVKVGSKGAAMVVNLFQLLVLAVELDHGLVLDTNKFLVQFGVDSCIVVNQVL